jgi:hypothetical protein
MIRYYNGGFDYWKLLELTYKQFLTYYSCLLEMLDAEGGREKKKELKNPHEVMQNIKKTFTT